MEDEEEYKHSPSYFYYPDEEELCNFNEAIVKTRITDSQEEIEGFINNQKNVNTTKKTMTDMNTLFRYKKENGLNSENIESLLAAELDHLFSKFFMNIRKKNGGGI